MCSVSRLHGRFSYVLTVSNKKKSIFEGNSPLLNVTSRGTLIKESV